MDASPKLNGSVDDQGSDIWDQPYGYGASTSSPYYLPPIASIANFTPVFPAHTAGPQLPASGQQVNPPRASNNVPHQSNVTQPRSVAQLDNARNSNASGVHAPKHFPPHSQGSHATGIVVNSQPPSQAALEMTSGELKKITKKAAFKVPSKRAQAGHGPSTSPAVQRPATKKAKARKSKGPEVLEGVAARRHPTGRRGGDDKIPDTSHIAPIPYEAEEQLSDPQACRNFIATYGKSANVMFWLLLPEEIQDDLEAVKAEGSEKYVKKIFEAMLTKPAIPVELDQQFEITQAKAWRSIFQRMQEPDQKTLAKANARLLYEAVIDMHEKGIPAEVDAEAKAKARAKKQSLAAADKFLDRELTCGARMTSVVTAISSNKVVALDLFGDSESKLYSIALSPGGILKKKIAEFKSNNTKKKKMVSSNGKALGAGEATDSAHQSGLEESAATGKSSLMGALGSIAGGTEDPGGADRGTTEGDGHVGAAADGVDVFGGAAHPGPNEPRAAKRRKTGPARQTAGMPTSHSQEVMFTTAGSETTGDTERPSDQTPFATSDSHETA